MNERASVPSLSIIIPVLHLQRPVNTRRFFMPRYTIREVLRDLQANVRMSHEVIVICNGDDPELVELVRAHEGIDKYCINNVNVGVARSWNMGAQMAEGHALCFLNDDVAVGQGALETLFDALYAQDDVGEVGPAGSKWKGARHARYVDGKDMEEADAISGFCFMLRGELFHRLGGVDINYTPAGFEEIDLSRTIRQAGYRCLVIPRLPIHHYHHHGVSAYRAQIKYLRGSIDTEMLHRRNKAYFIKKWAITDDEQGQ